ncbi:MAG: site-specific integrase [Candidatus Bathyarchaeota archaeon]|nr:site-specific integrase [Candidatus Termiticorpusculum sp.]
MTNNESIHDYEQRLVRSRRNINLLRNGKTALRFLDHLGAIGLSVARVSKYASHMPAILRIIDVDLKVMTKSEVETVVAAINGSNHKAWTKRDKKLVLRKLVQYAKVDSCVKGTPLPSEVSWISLAVKEKDSRVTPESLLTPDDFAAIIKASTNKRDRAMLYVLFEAALRPGELLTMTICSVIFKDEYCLIAANGKTGIKRIPLVLSCKPLLEWLEDHPNKTEPDAPLWCALDNNHLGKRLSYRHFSAIIKRIAQKGGIKKDIWPYLYRHTSLTAMAKVFTEARLEQFAGWTYGSKMTSRYVHFSARDLEDAVLELHGLKTATKDAGIAKLFDCPRCGNKNPAGKVRCACCGIVLDKETALKMEDANQQQVEEISVKQNAEVQARFEALEGAISSLLQQVKGKL